MHGLESIESALFLICEYGVCLFDAICIGIMLWGGIYSLIQLFKKKSHAKVAVLFSGYMDMALLFKLGAEILRMAFLRTFQELGLVAGIVVLHFAIGYIIHWENQHRQHGESAIRASGEAASIH